MNWFEIKSQVSADGNEADIFIFDEIGIWGISAAKLINEVQGLKPSRINLHVNSPGGSVTEGWAIFNYLRAHSAHVTTYVDGIAASIAGVIALAGDEIAMAEASLFHVHKPSIAGYVSENADGLEEIAAGLRKFETLLGDIYKRRTGADDAQVDAWFSTETYFTPQEALDAGIIDRIVDKVRMVASVAPSWDAERYPAVKQALGSHNLTNRHADSLGVRQKQQPHRKETENAMSKELEAKIATLEAEAKLSKKEVLDFQSAVDAVPAQIEAAVKDAETKTLAAEKNRRESIVAVRNQYNKEGDLDEIALNSIADGKDVAAFKDAVLEAIAKRPTTQALKQGTGGNESPAKSITHKEYNALSHTARREFKADGGLVVDA